MGRGDETVPAAAMRKMNAFYDSLEGEERASVAGLLVLAVIEVATATATAPNALSGQGPSVAGFVLPGFSAGLNDESAPSLREARKPRSKIA